MKSSRPWIPCGSHQSTLEGPLEDDISRLKLTAQPHLLALLAAWRARHSRKRPPCLPPWVCLFGLIYDSRAVHILAIFPFLPQSGQSTRPVVIDPDRHWQYHCRFLSSIPIQVVPGHHSQYQTVCRHRLRLATACWTIQRHLLRLTTLYDEVRWPTVVQSADIHRGDLVQSTVSPKRSIPDPDDLKLVAVSLHDVKRQSIPKVLEWKTKVLPILFGGPSSIHSINKMVDRPPVSGDHLYRKYYIAFDPRATNMDDFTFLANNNLSRCRWIEELPTRKPMRQPLVPGRPLDLMDMLSTLRIPDNQLLPIDKVCTLHIAHHSCSH